MFNSPHSLKTPRFLITGANGQLGFELQRALAPLGEVAACGRDACDLSSPDSIRAAVRAAKPDVIFSAGAYTAVDKAESEPDLARAVNDTAPGILGEEAAKLGALVIHYSTDYVFDGTKPSAYREEDATNPLGVYGKTKLEGENALAASGADPQQYIDTHGLEHPFFLNDIELLHISSCMRFASLALALQ